MYRTLNNFIFKDKKVLARIDIDLPLHSDGSIADDYRLRKALKTLNYLKNNGAKQIIMFGYMGRPKSKEDNLKTNKVAERLSILLGEKVLKLDDCIDVEIPLDYRFIMLENVRFHKEENENNEDFARKLASLGDIFVLEAFANSHRDQASVTGIQKFLPACAGFQLEKELTSLDISTYEKPIVGILGAAKISDKIKLISKLLDKVDTLILGGAIIFNFYKAEGLEVGKSLVDDKTLDVAKKLSLNKKIILPTDVVIAHEISDKAKIKTVRYNEIPKEYIGLDIGEETIERYKHILKDAKTVIWNGPLGMFEIEQFAVGTKEIANYITTLKVNSIVGGGDTANAIQSFGLEEKFTHVSTGGGASLSLLQGEELPGIVALNENAKRFG